MQIVGEEPGGLRHVVIGESLQGEKLEVEDRQPQSDCEGRDDQAEEARRDLPRFTQLHRTKKIHVRFTHAGFLRSRIAYPPNSRSTAAAMRNRRLS